MKYILATFALLAATTASAQHPPEHQDLHDQFYQNWLMPNVRDANGNRTNSCCSNHDCYPTEFKLVGGTWFAMHRESGKWIVVPDTKLEHNAPDPRESPDGRGHLCASSLGNVYCAVLGLQV